MASRVSWVTVVWMLVAGAATTGAAAALTACDKDEAKPGGDNASASAAASTSKPPPPPEPAPPRAPAITVDDHTCSIDGTPLTGDAPEWQTQATKILADKPLVAGEAVVVNMTRDTKAPKVLAVLAALSAAKAKTVKVRTLMRDQTSGEIELTLHAGAAPDCSAVAMIEHDGSVALWSKAGGSAQKFARGMAGPDLSTSTEALQKRAASCDSPVWYVGAAENITWGLTFDLAVRAKGSPDAGTSLRPTRTVLLTHPAPAHAVKEE
jgi:hypothetical protein